MFTRSLSIVLLAVCGHCCAADVDFARDVAPIFETHCLACHRGLTARGGFSLETPELAARGGESGPAIATGDPDASLLIDMVSGDSPAMPAEGAALTEAEVATLRTWIEAGAAWPADLKLRDKSPEALHW